MVLGVIAVSLFILAFLGGRRFGLLGLGLTAGVLLVEQLLADTSSFLSVNSVPVAPLGYTAAAIILLGLLPSILLLFAGPKVNGKAMRAGTAVLYAVFAVVLLYAPLLLNLPFAEPGTSAAFDALDANRSWLIAVFVALAIVDVFVSGKGGMKSHSRHK
tara:strand:- start:316 stop:792 length:477 start_codon:yes stop_codon:yes gene_type:complete